MKQLLIISFLTALVLTIPGSALAADGKELKPQTLCPVMGGNIDKSVYTDHDGKRIYFCCGACLKKFQADPDKYLNKMAENGEKPEELKTCGKCGEYKGSEKCCKSDMKLCSKCGLHKGSPGCCKPGANKCARHGATKVSPGSDN